MWACSVAARSASLASSGTGGGGRTPTITISSRSIVTSGGPVNQSGGSAALIHSTASSVGGGSAWAPPRPRPQTRSYIVALLTSLQLITSLQGLQHYTLGPARPQWVSRSAARAAAGPGGADRWVRAGRSAARGRGVPGTLPGAYGD